MGLLIGSLFVQICFCLFLTTRFLAATETELSAIQERLTDVLTESQTRYSKLYVIETSLATLLKSDDPRLLRNAYLNATASSFMTPSDLSEADRQNFSHLREAIEKIWSIRQQLNTSAQEARRLWQSMRTTGTTIDARIREKRLDRLFGDERTLAPSLEQIDKIFQNYVDQFEREVRPGAPEIQLLNDLRRYEIEYMAVRKDREKLSTQLSRTGNEAMAALDTVRHVFTANRTSKVLSHVDAIGQQVHNMRPGLELLLLLNATEFLVFLYFSARLARPIEQTSRILDDFRSTYEMPSALPKSNITEVQTLLDQLPLLLDSIATERENADRMRSERDVYRGLSYTDGLTGVSNRQAFERDNDRTAPLAEGTGMILLDIDHFKLINDTYGHAFGDGVLRKVGEFLRRSARADDKVYRYGGEEFCIVTKGADRRALERVGERIRSGIAALAFTTPDGQTFSVTASLGVTLCAQNTAPVKRLTELADIADKGLYEAKHLGRNRVVFRTEISNVSDF